MPHTRERTLDPRLPDGVVRAARHNVVARRDFSFDVVAQRRCFEDGARGFVDGDLEGEVERVEEVVGVHDGVGPWVRRVDVCGAAGEDDEVPVVDADLSVVGVDGEEGFGGGGVGGGEEVLDLGEQDEFGGGEVRGDEGLFGEEGGEGVDGGDGVEEPGLG